MGQKLRDDKIGTLGHSSRIITLTASTSSSSWLTIGSQQYKIKLYHKGIAWVKDFLKTV